MLELAKEKTEGNSHSKCGWGQEHHMILSGG